MYIIAGVLIIILTIYIWRNRSRSAHAKLSNGFPLPPGPPRKPLVGNLFDVPTSAHWHRFLEWKVQYGELVYVEALGNKMLVVNTLDALSDILESRPTIYCDRPRFTMAGELMGLDNTTVFLQYGDEWKTHRKFIHMALGPEAVKNYALTGDFAAKYVASLLDSPGDFKRQLRLVLGRITMAVTYGIPVDTPDDLYITHAEQTLQMIVRATVPGTFLVDLIPSLKYLPAWVPFNHIPATAASGREVIWRMITSPYEHVKREREQGTNRPSFASDCLDKYTSEDPEVQASVEHTLLWAAGTMYGSGVETSYSTTLSFILALAMYPDVQVKLKEELTRVIGTERLPTLEDRGALPYLEATIKEALRWRPAVPLGVPRMTRTADIYKGYYIPEGTAVFPNIWAISKDDKSGFSPEDFVPERHLADKVEHTAVDPYTYAFGFGRRICPGKYLADNVIFMLLSHMVATVHVSKKKDGDGNEIPLMSSYTSGIVSHPHPFEVDIKPGSRNARAIVGERLSRCA